MINFLRGSASIPQVKKEPDFIFWIWSIRFLDKNLCALLKIVQNVTFIDKNSLHYSALLNDANYSVVRKKLRFVTLHFHCHGIPSNLDFKWNYFWVSFAKIVAIFGLDFSNFRNYFEIWPEMVRSSSVCLKIESH